ncbi:MAG: hypothetical protein Q4C91_04995 [Eubacteriales bacterium]|nr:hypothetical protein [Eubacteriales bacterium]
MLREIAQNCFLWPVRRYFSKRTLEINVILFFICMIMLLPIREICISYNYPVAPYCLPHLFNYLYFQLAFFSVVLYFFSNVPFMNEWEAYRIIRMGRSYWCSINIWMIIVHSYLLMFNLLIWTIIPLTGILEYDQTWGKLLYTLSAVGDDRMYFGISYKIISEYSSHQAMAICFLLGGAVISFLGLFMFCISVWANRTTALVSATVIVGLPLIAENYINLYYNKYMWLFSPISWLRLEYIENDFVRGLPDLQYIKAAITGLIILCIVFILIKVRSIDFKWNGEEIK